MGTSLVVLLLTKIPFKKTKRQTQKCFLLATNTSGTWYCMSIPRSEWGCGRRRNRMGWAAPGPLPVLPGWSEIVSSSSLCSGQTEPPGGFHLLGGRKISPHSQSQDTMFWGMEPPCSYTENVLTLLTKRFHWAHCSKQPQR